MRYSQALLPTLKEAPNDATSQSHILLLRAGYVRRVGAGIYSFLPLGVRVLRKVETIVREEMNRAGAEEVLLPALLPAEYFKESGRWDVFGDTLLRLKDRKGADYHLGPTHEEVITDLARRELRSYRDLPRNLYQIQTKFRDEPRPRGGILRGREFIMKDAYSFDADETGARKSYEAMRLAYRRVLDRMGFDYRMVSADSGAMGGSGSAEFQILVQSGEDVIAACSKCDYGANLEVATTPPKGRVGPAPESVPNPERVHTPNQRTIEEVASFLGAEPTRFLKSLLYVAAYEAKEGEAKGKDEVVMAVVRGDHAVNEIRLARALGAREVFLAADDVVRAATGAPVGFAGPVGFSGKIVLDVDASSVSDGITGANLGDYHTKHVQYPRDFSGTVHAIRSVNEGDACNECGSPLKLYRGIEAGHIFLLGTHYSQKMSARFLDETGQNRPFVMGCYGIGISRLVAAAVEQRHDQNGLMWPMALAPYQVHIVTLGQDEKVLAASERLERELTELGVEVLVDDRTERPGVKFKDADLIGIPLRVTIGEKSLATGNVELKARSVTDPKLAELVPVGDAARVLKTRIAEALR